MSANYKVMIHASGTQITDLAAAIGTYPAFDGLVANVQSPAEKAGLQAIAAARPDLQIWLYISALEYPFSLTAGLVTEWWDWVRGNVQFMANVAGSATRARMVTGGQVGCFFAYCYAPTQEFYEIVAWPAITAPIADAMVTKLTTMAADISPRCGVYSDQTWLRMFSWMTDDPPPVPCNVVTFESGHGATSETPPQLAAATYAALDAAFGGANNWREWYDDLAYFQTQLDAATPAGAWNLHNGEVRIDHALNLDPGLLTFRNPFSPMFIESVHSNILLAPGYLITATPLWYLDPRNVLGINYQGQPQYLQDAKDAWLARGGGWISLHGYAPMDPLQIAAVEELSAYAALLDSVTAPPTVPGATSVLKFTTLAQLREYLPADGTLTDAQLTDMGARAEEIVEMGAGRAFRAVTESRIFNGTGTQILDVHAPMSAVTAVEERCCGDTWEDLDLGCLSLSRSGMLLLIGNVVPIPFRRINDWRPCGFHHSISGLDCGVFPMGTANIRVTGTWSSATVPLLAITAVGTLVRYAGSCDDPVGAMHTAYRSESVGGDRTIVLREIEKKAGVDMSTGYPDVDAMIAKLRGLSTARFRVF